MFTFQLKINITSYCYYLYVGAFGIDFSSFKSTEQAEQGLLKVSQELLKYGVTSFCPTLVTSSQEYYNKVNDEFNKLLLLLFIL